MHRRVRITCAGERRAAAREVAVSFGAALSSVKVIDPEPVRPAALISVATIVCCPSASPAGP